MMYLAQITYSRIAEWLVNNDPDFGPETSIGEIPDTKHMHKPLDCRETMKGKFVCGRTFWGSMDLYANMQWV